MAKMRMVVSGLCRLPRGVSPSPHDHARQWGAQKICAGLRTRVYSGAVDGVGGGAGPEKAHVGVEGSSTPYDGLSGDVVGACEGDANSRLDLLRRGAGVCCTFSCHREPQKGGSASPL